MTVSRFLQIISGFLKMVKIGEKNCLPKFVYKIFNLGMGRVRTSYSCFIAGLGFIFLGKVPLDERRVSGDRKIG